MLFVAFVGAAILLAMVPGVSTAVIIRQTLRAGRGAGIAATLGNETGILLWALAAVFGLSALVTASQIAYDILRVAGAVVLIVMGVQSLWQARRGSRTESDIEADTDPATVPGLRGSYGVGFATVLANPKAAVFAVSFLPQFVPSGANVPATLTGLAIAWVIVDMLWYATLIWFIGRIRTVFSRPAVRRALERVTGTILIGLGLRLITE